MNSKPKSQRSAVGSKQSLRVRKPTRKKPLNRRSVMKAIAAMENTPQTSEDPVQEFLTTGRTGRRNAMPDILGQHAKTSTGDLPDCLEKLNTSDNPSSSEASTSGVATQSSTPQPQSSSQVTGPLPDGTQTEASTSKS